MSTAPPTTAGPTTSPPDEAMAVFKTDANNPPITIQSRVRKDASSAKASMMIIGFVAPGDYYKLEQASATVTIFRWYEVNW